MSIMDTYRKYVSYNDGNGFPTNGTPELISNTPGYSYNSEFSMKHQLYGDLEANISKKYDGNKVNVSYNYEYQKRNHYLQQHPYHPHYYQREHHNYHPHQQYQQQHKQEPFDNVENQSKLQQDDFRQHNSVSYAEQSFIVPTSKHQHHEIQQRQLLPSQQNPYNHHSPSSQLAIMSDSNKMYGQSTLNLPQTFSHYHHRQQHRQFMDKQCQDKQAYPFHGHGSKSQYFGPTNREEKGDFSMWDILFSGGSPLPNVELDFITPSLSTCHDTPPSSPESAAGNIHSLNQASVERLNNSYCSTSPHMAEISSFQAKQSMMAHKFEASKEIMKNGAAGNCLINQFQDHGMKVQTTTNRFNDSYATYNTNSTSSNDTLTSCANEKSKQIENTSNALVPSCSNNHPVFTSDLIRKSSSSFMSPKEPIATIKRSCEFSNPAQCTKLSVETKYFNYTPPSPVSIKSASPMQDLPKSSSISQIGNMDFNPKPLSHTTSPNNNERNSLHHYFDDRSSIPLNNSPLRSHYSDNSLVPSPTNYDQRFESSINRNSCVIDVEKNKMKEQGELSTSDDDYEDIKNKLSKNSRRSRKTKKKTSGKPRLYNFLCEMLNEKNPCIEWADKATGTFKFLDSSKVAHLWGLRKNKPNMQYENFARSLRTYIKKGILTKPRNKLVYRFSKLPNGHPLNQQ